MFPPKPQWSVDQIPDLSGKVMLVTGANTGIGKETCKKLLKNGATVYLAARSETKGHEAIGELKELTGREAAFLHLDLADLDSVRRAAAEFSSKETMLHVLFANAGVMTPPMEQLTTEGYDLQFGTNVVGHYLFIRLLLPLLISTFKSSGELARIVVASCSVHFFHNGPIQYDTLKDTTLRKKKGLFRLYCQSKFGSIMVAKELARRYSTEGVITISLDPGNIQSDLQRHGGPTIVTEINKVLLHPLPIGALSQLYAGTTPEGASLNGKYLRPWARVGVPHPGTQDQRAAEELWDWLETETMS